MPEGADNSDDFDTTIERIFNNADLDGACVDFDALVKAHAGKEIERIFNESSSLEDSQAKITDLIKVYAEKALSKVTDEGARKQAIEAKVDGITTRLAEYEKDKNPDRGQSGDGQEKQLDSITPESKKNFEKLLKNFVVYEIYQEMNPRRIAGETERSNYIDNVALRGVEVAEKFVKKGKLSEPERESLQKRVLMEVRARGGELTRRESSLDLGQVDAHSQASGIRGALTRTDSFIERKSSESAVREAQQQKQAEARRNQGPGQEQGGPGVG